MVHLVLSTTRGNSGNRFFPHQGYLGLTPVRVEGIVRTRFDEDRKPIPAKSLSVSIRCYQSRLTRSRSFRLSLVVDHTDVLWLKPPDKDYSDIGELEFPFKITLPKRTPGFSTANYQDYRVFWRLEAILDHVPIPSVGSRLVRYNDLALFRYDLPPSVHPPPTLSPSQHSLLHETNKPRAPVVRYTVSAPALPVGPSDIIYATVFLQPQDPAVTIRSATVSVERRIELHNAPAAPTPLVTAGINHAMAASASPTTPFSPASMTPSSYSDDDARTPTTSRFASGPLAPSAYPQSPYGPHIGPSQATFESVATDVSYSSTMPLLSPTSSNGSSSPIPIPVPPPSRPPPSPSSSLSASPRVSSTPSSDSPLRIFTVSLVSTEVNSFARDPSGLWVKSVTLQWPENRGTSRWAIGETMNSEFATVRFFIRTKLVVTGPGGSDTLELEPKEVTIVPTNEADRRVAMEKWSEQKELAQRSKSKSPWRRRGEDGTSADVAHAQASGHGLPSPPQTPAQTSEGEHRKTPSASTGSKPRKKAPRRPHTSAGPRDKSNFTFAAAADTGSRFDPDQSDPMSSQESRSSVRSSHSHGSSKGKFRESGLGESMLNAVDKVRGKSRAREGDGKRGREPVEDDQERRERPKTAGLGLQLALEDAQIRAWEEELARIELQSRRSSAGMLGLLGMTRKRTGG
ncbi:hypothetical protein OH76DRAFT_1352532 [Lentinus brumalis]|uniref:Uncharacterized protein n=1 Tax=Lentinus brumalis TaxID=2498619 RepID=A0A371D714_9APHY|nr:hypothetical protein OH76DRAFT_1352532 [Polyporus brumalis]